MSHIMWNMYFLLTLLIFSVNIVLYYNLHHMFIIAGAFLCMFISYTVGAAKDDIIAELKKRG